MRRQQISGNDCGTPAGPSDGNPSPPSAQFADWKLDMRESCALVRRAIREGWPTERGGEILAALLSGEEPMACRDIVRAGRLLLEIDAKSHV